jgi:hypothetical protein
VKEPSEEALTQSGARKDGQSAGSVRSATQALTTEGTKRTLSRRVGPADRDLAGERRRDARGFAPSPTSLGCGDEALDREAREKVEVEIGRGSGPRVDDESVGTEL